MCAQAKDSVQNENMKSTKYLQLNIIKDTNNKIANFLIKDF